MFGRRPCWERAARRDGLSILTTAGLAAVILFGFGVVFAVSDDVGKRSACCISRPLPPAKRCRAIWFSAAGQFALRLLAVFPVNCAFPCQADARREWNRCGVVCLNLSAIVFLEWGRTVWISALSGDEGFGRSRIFRYWCGWFRRRDCRRRIEGRILSVADLGRFVGVCFSGNVCVGRSCSVCEECWGSQVAFRRNGRLWLPAVARSFPGWLFGF